MFPGFITLYKDKDNYIHLYFFPGIDDNNDPIYNDLDLYNCKLKHEKILHDDKSIEFIFYNKTVIKMTCTLVEFKTGNQHKETLVVKKN